ncbi:MAG: hypothetical protein WD096_04965 [Actinomycetota bacterium]
MIALLALGIAPLAFLYSSGGGSAGAGSLEETRTDCTYPQAVWKHPEWPEPTAAEQDPYFDPFANVVAEVESIGEVDGDSARKVDASVVWPDAGTADELRKAFEGSATMDTFTSVWWTQARERLANGDSIYVGGSSVGPDGSVNISWAITASGNVLGDTPYAERATLMLRSFVEEFRPDASSIDVMVDWNQELSNGGSSKTQRAWDSFLEAELATPAPAFGTRQWWDAVSPDCRSVVDAPPEILSDLETTNVSFDLPEEWLDVKGLAICLSSELGSLGCTDTQGDRGALLGDALVGPNQELTVSIADSSSGGVGFDRLIHLGSISSGSIDAAVGATITVESNVDPVVLNDLIGAERPTMSVKPGDEGPSG